MIASVRGTVLTVGPDHLVVEVGGVGLKVMAPRPVLDEIDRPGRSVHLHTILVVREDALALYGFLSEDERSLFELLIGVSGIGPKLALAVLSNLAPDELRRAVAHGESATLARVPGVGRKTAEKIAFHLRDKIGTLGQPLRAGRLAALSELDAEVLAALTSLGYSVVEAQSAIQAIPAEADGDVANRVRLALQQFASP